MFLLKITDKGAKNQFFHAFIRKSRPPLRDRCIFQLYGPIRLLRIENQSCKVSRITPFDGTLLHGNTFGF